jgi:hypothetical protein
MMSGNNEDVDLKLTNGTVDSVAPLSPVHAKMFQLVYHNNQPTWQEHQ